MYDVILLELFKSCHRFSDINFQFIILPFKVKVIEKYYRKQSLSREIERREGGIWKKLDIVSDEAKNNLMNVVIESRQEGR
jgi:hypothetical protein